MKTDEQQEPDIHICINEQCNDVGHIGYDKKKLTALLKKTAEKYGIKKAVINIVIAEEQAVVQCNKKFLDKNKPTDVISFDLTEENEDCRQFDIIVNAHMARQQAEKRNCTAEAELMLYCLHGLLHNLGFDDLNDEDAKKMHTEEDEILTEFGYGTVYSLPEMKIKTERKHK